MKDILCAGEALIDFVSQDAGDLKGSKVFEKRPGGSPMNVAMALSRLENDVKFLGKLSSDPFGSFLKEFMEGEGIDTSFIEISDEHSTTLAFVAVDESGNPDFVFYRENSADRHLEFSEISLDPEDFSIYHFGSMAIIDGETSITLLKIFEKFLGGVLTSFDPNVRRSVITSREEYLKKIDSVLRHSDIVKLSDEDMGYIFGKADVKKFVEKYGREDKITIMTMGQSGSVLYKEGKLHHQEAATFGVTVDTTGCGDAFMAGILHVVGSEGTDWTTLKKAMDFASKVSGIVATRRGADMPKIEDIEHWEG